MINEETLSWVLIDVSFLCHISNDIKSPSGQDHTAAEGKMFHVKHF